MEEGNMENLTCEIRFDVNAENIYAIFGGDTYSHKDQLKNLDCKWTDMYPTRKVIKDKMEMYADKKAWVYTSADMDAVKNVIETMGITTCPTKGDIAVMSAIRSHKPLDASYEILRDIALEDYLKTEFGDNEQRVLTDPSISITVTSVKVSSNGKYALVDIQVAAVGITWSGSIGISLDKAKVLPKGSCYSMHFDKDADISPYSHLSTRKFASVDNKSFIDAFEWDELIAPTKE